MAYLWTASHGLPLPAFTASSCPIADAARSQRTVNSAYLQSRDPSQ